MREIVVRSISGILYVLVVVFSMYTSRELFMTLFLILGLQTLKEFKKLIHLKHFTPYLLLPISLLLISYYYPGDIILYTYLGISLLVSILLAKDVQSTKNSLLLKKQKYIPTMLYIISGFVFLTLIPFSKGVFKPEIIVGVFVLIWCNDTFAYIIGKSLGKNKLLERVSPKKTIEGTLGGAIVTVLIMSVLNTYWLRLEEPMYLLTIVIIFFATFGDFVESYMKRKIGVKHSGKIMPGHGGVLDRLDSIYPSALPYLVIMLLVL